MNRVEINLRQRGIRHDLINSIFFLAEYDLARLIKRIEALDKFLATDDGANLLTAYRRAANIVAIEERRDHQSYNGRVALRLPELGEQRLYSALNALDATLQPFLAVEDFEGAMGRLATLRRPVDEFFDKVTVNTDNPALRENRLRLLSRIRAVMNQVADFSQIEG